MKSRIPTRTSAFSTAPLPTVGTTSTPSRIARIEQYVDLLQLEPAERGAACERANPLHQTSGSSTCCDYWFIDDVRLAAPLVSEWTSPTIGWGGGVSNVEEGRWSDVSIEAELCRL